MSILVRKTTVDLIAKLLHPLAETGTLSVPEEREIVAQLRSLAKTGEVLPVVIPKLIGQPEVAAMLGISLASFKKMERNGVLPFPRKKIGTSVRYRNTDVVRYILAESEPEVNS